MKKLMGIILFLSITALAFFVRTYNLNWDDGTHIHPDERFLTMVTNDLHLPDSFVDYLNPQVSPMNPHNVNYGFFVYGTFPVYLVKILAILFRMDDYGNITILGRFISAIFDTGIIVFLFLLTRKLLPDQKLKTKFSFLVFIPSLLYSIMVLPIQLSHFFAVDTFLAFFMIVSVYLSVSIRGYINAQKWGKVFLFSYLAGTAIGLGLACKVTMLFVIPLNLLIISSVLLNGSKFKIKDYLPSIFVYSYIPIFIVIYLSFRLAQPMAFSDGNLLNFSFNPLWIKNITDLQNMSSSSLTNTFPPSIQWFTTQPIIFPLKNMVLWGMGPPLGVLCIISLFYILRHGVIGGNLRLNKNNKLIVLLISLFTLVFFIYQGSQFAKAMRYINPNYWCLAMNSGLIISEIISRYHDYNHETHHHAPLQKTIISIILLIALIALFTYPISFLQIYTRPQTRVSASRWIFQNLTPNSSVTFEQWDDPLPLLVDGKTNLFPGKGLSMFSPDSREKWNQIFDIITNSNYIILSSNRVYGSIPRRPDLYPETSKYYKLLFEEKLGFKKVAEFSSRPTVPLFNYEFIDDGADETFTVYDHPRVLIYENVEKFSKERLFSMLYE